MRAQPRTALCALLTTAACSLQLLLPISGTHVALAQPQDSTPPTGPAPTDPAPTDPAPTDPAPSDPAPTDPNPAEGDGSDPNTVSPPKLLQEASTLPPEGLELQQPAAVDLELTVSAEGKVIEAKLLSSEDDRLNEHALSMARQFTFDPAKQNGTPVAVVIQYRYWFEPNGAPEPASTDPTGGAFTPAPHASADEASSPARAAATEQGAAAAASPASAADTEDEEVYEAVAEVDAPPRETTKRTLDKQVLTRMPGTRGDAIRAIEVLPGVARAPDGENPLIRGGGQFESLALVDGTPIPLLYHFGGVTSVIPSRLLERVDLYPGNFSARYGRATAGVVEAQLRDPKTDGFHALVDISLIDSSAMVESPIGDQLSVAVGGRRSNIDLVFDSFVPEGAFDVLAAPLYWDYQGIATYRPSANHKLRLAAFGGRDQLRLLFDDPSKEDPTLRGDLDVSREFHKLQLLYEGQFDQVRQSLVVALGKQDLHQVFGPDTRAYFEIYELDARGEWEVTLGHTKNAANQLMFGFDVGHQTLIGAYRGSVASPDEGSLPYDNKNRGELVVNETTIGMTSPAVYVEARVHPTEAWQLVPGMRVDYYTLQKAATINPRLSSRYQLTDATALKAGVGGYSQPPLYYESFDPVGNPEVDPYHALHTSLGVEHEFGGMLQLDVEAFYKSLWNRVVGTEDSAPPFFENGGKGRIYGLETGATFRPSEATFAQLSYTLSRSERRDHGERWRLFDSDQPHILNLAAGHSWDSGWELGLRFRYVSGNPNTPVERAVYDATSDVYTPIFGAHNSTRDGAFHQLDVRAEKRFSIGPGSLSIYLDIQNVYNQENPEGYSYSYDYSKKEVVSGLPFFPNLGLRGEL